LIATGAGLSGTFTNVTALGAYATVNGNGLTYDYVAGTVTLTLAKALNPADGNLDGQTDVSDRILWNNNNFTFGTTFTTGDWNGDGQTDVSDRIVWNNHNFTFATATPPPQNAPSAPATGDLDETMAAGSFSLRLTEMSRTIPDAPAGDAAMDDADVAPAQSPLADPVELPAPASESPAPESTATWTGTNDAAAPDGAQLELALEVDLGSIPGGVV